MRQRAIRFALLSAALAAVAVTAGRASSHTVAAAAAPRTHRSAHRKSAALHHPLRVLQGLELVAQHNRVRKTAAHRKVAHRAVVDKTAARTNAALRAAAPAPQLTGSVSTPASDVSPAPQPNPSVRFEWPAQGTITTPFIPSGPSRHDGIDIGELRSLTVIAAHSGEVIHVGYTVDFAGYGNIVDIAFASGYETIYAHLSAMNVQVGQQVSEGQVIGTAGCTGRCTGTHVHFEVRENGTPVNPLDFLP